MNEPANDGFDRRYRYEITHLSGDIPPGVEVGTVLRDHVRYPDTYTYQWVDGANEPTWTATVRYLGTVAEGNA